MTNQVDAREDIFEAFHAWLHTLGADNEHVVVLAINLVTQAHQVGAFPHVAGGNGVRETGDL